ncbi:unnamed protein product [Dibothriocephalus latus]|uniref:VWFA domain-containing protein n=1 Tax=Dibothriocephalus latus TaxID=60516 RepID=A0A3P6TAS9_DIBLA|nr:unnamed protein product [Dibothriocephalus latus]
MFDRIAAVNENIFAKRAIVFMHMGTTSTSVVIVFEQEAYQRLINEGTVTLEHLKPLQNVKEYASKLSELFSKKAAALEEVVQDMEEEAAKYPLNPLLKNISFTSLTDFDPNLERHHYFDIPVNQSQSGVYLPAEVYINDSTIAHQVDWTSNTDHIFKKQNDTLNFIYFASVYGFLRIYPRFQWPVDDKIRALDARRRSWYTQYTSVPKDVLFLVDTSGSMHGQALHLVNTSLRLLIQNLNRNDFFAVAKFPADRNHPAPTLLYGCSQNESCYNLLVQATGQNKQHAIQNVFRLVAENGANYDEAIFFGLKLMSTRRMSSYFVDVDLIDIEAAMSPDMLQLRNDIIDNKEGVSVVDDFALFLDEPHSKFIL